jgi:hypothetical protein
MTFVLNRRYVEDTHSTRSHDWRWKLAVTPNRQLQRTVTRRRGDGASAPFHFALAPRFTRQRAAAELRR